MATSGAILGMLDLNNVETSGVQWVLENVKGWGGSPASTISPQPKPRQRGAWGGLAYRKARSVVISGTCACPTPDLAWDALDRLNDADFDDDTTVRITESGRELSATVRRDGEVLPAWMGDTAFSYSLQLVAVDPRKMGADLTASTSLPSTTGGLTWPVSWPLIWPATTVTGQVSLTNPGNEVGPVTLRIDGPVTGPSITHVGSGLSLTFSTSLTLNAGEFVTVDMERREVLAQGQSAASRAKWVTSRGWSGFEPGVNTWAFSAAGGGTGTLQVTATPAWQ